MSYMYALFVNMYDNLYYMLGRKIKGIRAALDTPAYLKGWRGDKATAP
ncbi:hypothetical protein At15955_32420 [Agrobacterium tumefaciens]|nr:hypothetical protein Ach5_33110 [Agrobacterium tumefaciens]AYM18227.1 hypothetical protein At15955_32420 [Agrobacterium tumefaciens]AYM69526.1 hypothetical protein AtA6_33100 [Agrobacterium tumefaciens]